MYDTLGNTGISMYNLLNAAGVFALIIFNFTQLKEKSKLLSNTSGFLFNYYSKKKRRLFSNVYFWATLETIIISVVQYLPAAILNTKFGLLMKTGSNYFGLILFIPFILFLFFYLISINPFKQLDLVTPAYPLALFFVKLGCFCNGCCQGFECSWGMTNYYYNAGPRKEFPVQLVEAGLALLIFLFLNKYKKKAKEGTLFPIYLIVYSSTRFFSEFLRSEENVLWILKTYHLICIAGIILGTIELLIVLRYGDKIKKLFNRKVFKGYKEKNIVHHKK